MIRWPPFPLLFVAACAAPPQRPMTTADYLAQDVGIPLAEAERRIAHQDALHALVARAGADPAWGGLSIEHRPDYRIILKFTDGRPRPELLALVPADLRPHILFGTALRSRREVDRLMNELSRALQPLGGDWNLMYDETSGRFTVNVARRGQIERARELVPAHLRPHTDVRIGPQIIPT